MPARAIVRSRWSVSVIFFINGVILASWVPHIPAVKQHLGIGDGQLGLMLLSMAAGAVYAGAAGAVTTRSGHSETAAPPATQSRRRAFQDEPTVPVGAPLREDL